MNWPQQPQMQPFPGQPAPQPQQPFPGQQMPVANVAAAAQQNTFAQMLTAPARKRMNREKPADGTHVVQFTLETKMDNSQQTMQPYLLVSYVVIESTVPQMVNKTYAVPMMMASRGAVQALAEMAKVVFGPQYVAQLAAQNVAPYQIAQILSQYLVNPQTKVGLFALLNTWRSKKGQNGGPPPSYDEAFVNHDWMMAAPSAFTLAQAQAAGHRITSSAPPAPMVTGPVQGWAGVPTAPAQQQQFQPAPQAPVPQQQFHQQQVPQPLPAPQAQPFPAFNVPPAPQPAPAPMAPPGFPQQPTFPPPANVQPQPGAPAAFIPQQSAGLPPVPGR